MFARRARRRPSRQSSCRSVAQTRKAGETIEPQLYTLATVGFTDIVQFTNFCAQSTPMHVVTLLKQLVAKHESSTVIVTIRAL